MDLFDIITQSSNHINNNYDCLALILSFLNRKNKYRMREVSRAFRDNVVPRCMVSLAFRTMNPFVQVY